MIVSNLSYWEIVGKLAGLGLSIRTGPLVFHVCSDFAEVANAVALHYSDHPLDTTGFADFHVAITRPRNVRRWYRSQALFHFDGTTPFKPLPANQASPILEWGLNWCISGFCHQFLTVHAAVVEKRGHALILPAPPGSGKSTLCAALVSRGWRLLSDELTLIDPATSLVTPLARPVGLKNESIAIIRDFSAAAILGPVVHETLKGSVAHMKPPPESVRRSAELAHPRWIVLPRYQSGAAPTLSKYSKANAFMRLAQNCFNFDLHGEAGFKAFARVIDDCDCYEFTYSKLEDACAMFERLCIDA